MSAVKDSVKNYLMVLMRQYDQLAGEKATLQAAAARIAVIVTEQADLVGEAQTALARFNSLHGTSYTLTQARAALLDGISPE